MRFQRSNSGLSSLYLFYGVDAIVFVEGGRENLSLDAVRQGAFNEIAHDAKFWSKLFSRFLPRLKFKFRPVGSKTTLKELADLVATERVRNIVVCMDRDFDNFVGQLIQHPRVAYTYGYSWENDAWSLGSSISVFRKIGHTTQAATAIAEIESAFAAFSRALRWPLLAHALLVTNGLLQVTNADLERAVMRGAGQMPVLNCADLRRSTRTARPRSPKPCVRFPTPARFSVMDDCYGHLLSTYAFHVVAHILRKHCNIRAFGKDVAASIAIESSYGAIMRKKAKRLHYKGHFDAISAAISRPQPDLSDASIQ